jgi:hypothetical protein
MGAYKQVAREHIHGTPRHESVSNSGRTLLPLLLLLLLLLLKPTRRHINGGRAGQHMK